MNSLLEITPTTTASERIPISAGPAIAPEQFSRIRRRAILEGCKWDPQVGDVSTLAEFPLLISEGTWRELAALTEALASEVMEAEQELLSRPASIKKLGFPRALRHALNACSESGTTPTAVRSIRFDFHYTTHGWQISEANSDVPGGFTEASWFTKLIANEHQEFAMCGDPLEAWCRSLLQRASNGKIALLSAPGFMEDQQIMALLAGELSKRGCATHLANPLQIEWREGEAFLKAAWSSERMDALVRFYQGEWLAALPRRCGWTHFFSGGKTPVANPGIGVLAESKRFPLTWDNLSTPMTTWRRLLPETREPGDAPWRTDDSWLLKSAMCNTGDTVSIRELMNAKQWKDLQRDIWWNPTNWIAQRRFQTLPIETPRGAMYPCLGVYTIDGKASGVYARLSPTPLIDFAAVDAALLVAPDH